MRTQASAFLVSFSLGVFVGIGHAGPSNPWFCPAAKEYE